MYTLYGFKRSGSAAIEMALSLADAPFKTLNAASWEKNSLIQELGKINPLKQIPTLVLPDGSILTESAAMLIHLGLTFPSSGILPSDSALRAQAIRGLVYIAANCYSAIGIIDYPERWISKIEAPLSKAEGSISKVEYSLSVEDSIKESVRKGSQQRLHNNWGIFADMFPYTPFLGGAQPNALDFLAVVVSKWSGTRAYLQDTHPDFLSLLKRVESHEKVSTVFGRHWQV